MKRFAWKLSRALLCVVLLCSGACAASARLVPGPLSEEWVEQEAKPPLSSFYYLVKDGKIAAELRTVEEHIRIRLTPIAYLRLVQKNSLESAFENYRPGATTGAVVAGKPAVRHDFTFSVKNGNRLQGRVFCFLDGNTGLAVLFVALQEAFEVLEADLRERRRYSFVHGATTAYAVRSERLPEVALYREYRVEAAHRTLHHHRDGRTPKPRQRLGSGVVETLPPEEDLSSRPAHPLRQQAGYGEARERLPRSARADDTRRLPRPDVERHASHKLLHRRGDRFDAQIANLQQRAHFTASSSMPERSSASRIASPSRLKAITTTKIASPG